MLPTTGLSRPWKLFSALLKAVQLAYAPGTPSGAKADGLSLFGAGEWLENKN